MRRAGTLTFKEIYDHLLAHTSDRRVQVDGLILENSRSALLANEAQYQSLDGAFANLAAFWSFINFDALEFTPTADGFSQVTEALTQSTVKPSSLNLVTTTVCGMGIGNAIFKKLKGPSPKGARSSYMGNPNAPMKEPNPNAPYAPILGGACTIQHSQMGSQTGYSAYMLAGTMRQHGPEAMFDETELDDIAERGVDPNAFVNYLGGCFRGSDGQGTLGDELAAACESDAAS